MKIRKGFVSNSSSSSFVIAASDKVKTVFDLAKQMIEIRDWEEEDDKDIDKVNSLVSAGVDPDHPLSFRTCNYDTFIIPTEVDGKKYFVVSTCNNHDFYEMSDISYSSSLKEKITGQKSYNPDLIDFVEDNHDFIWLDNGLLGRPTNDDKSTCSVQHHYDNWVQPDGSVVCVRCGK